MRFFALSLALALASLVSSTAIPEGCDGTTVLDTYIGEDRNVHTEVIQCQNIPVLASQVGKRDDVCGANCTTDCFTPSGGGPDPNDCQVIADALLYDSQNVGALFTLDPTNGTQRITMQYRSCLTYMLNQDVVPITYCRTDWSQLVEYIAFNCQAEQNAHGGLCVADDQRWVQST
ncbi:hypothetical protein NM688_g4442 [Phlebia brevispora]|uniref:Uncharacterized protein n=1 Tax=Phlebia brevispora TaxID=194682 RepID=A0ACC1T2M2_9APHY|nr:hypothetical protein NM688_g4442 [Phlebia brevispora]